MSKIYVASSWKNEFQPELVSQLRSWGHCVYDFRELDDFTSWTEVDDAWPSWTALQYVNALSHKAAERGFSRDMAALATCEMCIMVMPCGVSASLELGWACGAGKRTAVYIPSMREPELMVKMAHFVTADMYKLLSWVNS